MKYYILKNKDDYNVLVWRVHDSGVIEGKYIYNEEDNWREVVMKEKILSNNHEIKKISEEEVFLLLL